MPQLNLFFRRHPQSVHWAAYAVTAGLFLWLMAQFYIPGKGFTYLIRFGDRPIVRYLPELRRLNYYAEEDSPGYDAQYYAQMAMHPRLGDAALGQAVDDLPYRARRILFCWTAWALAGGVPGRALQIYAVQNIVCWLLLAGLMLRWFPPVNWGNYVRWAATLVCSGLCLSVRNSLLDGPSLLLIAAGVAWTEKGCPWLAAAVLGLAGLGRETNILGAAALARPCENTAREWVLTMMRGLVVVLPLLLWLACLWRWLGGGGAGARNFGLPLAGYLQKWRETRAQFWGADFGTVAKGSLAMLVVLTTQLLFFALRPRWKEPWWRIGAAYSVLMIFMGDAVWEGYPGAAGRVLLPMTLAFNVLVPRGRQWWLVLLLGNLTVAAAPDILMAPAPEGWRVEGPRALRTTGLSEKSMEAVFDAQWFSPEHSHFTYWRWSRGPAVITVRNPHPFSLVADLRFGLNSLDGRRIIVCAGDRILWEGEIGRASRDVIIRDLRLPPGDTLLSFKTGQPSLQPGKGEMRVLAFCLSNFEILLKARDSTPAR
ncbi:MAG TPA: hypothetical protein VK717_06370 [Opitutaceae bacterium]|nr:hypothetical protein [Opitutaceae bacterium]